MSDALPFRLKYKANVQVGVFVIYIILDLGAQVSDNKNKFADAGLEQLVDYNAEYGFTCERNQCLRLGIRVRSEFCTGACYGNNCFHIQYLPAGFSRPDVI